MPSYRKTVFSIFLSLFLVVLLNSPSSSEALLADRIEAAHEGSEKLVVSDIGGGGAFSNIYWCGDNALLVESEKFGLEWFDFNGKRVVVSPRSYSRFMSCTPDGKWVLYEDMRGARIYRDKHGRAPTNAIDEGIGWHGFVIDLYRYELATGARQRFAVARDDSSGHVSPDGLKVLLGNRHDSDINMPEPEWERVWFTNEWHAVETLWFTDSSGVATTLWSDGSSVGVEVFGKTGWAKEYSIKQIDEELDERSGVFLQAIDKDNRLYLLVLDETSEGRWPVYRFYVCVVGDKNISCEESLRLDEPGLHSDSIRFLPSGDVVVKKDDDACIRRIGLGRSRWTCVADMRFKDEAYEDIRLVGQSSGGRQLAIRRGKKPQGPGKGFYAYQYDLFVMDILEDKE